MEERAIGSTRLQVVVGDITKLEVDAIVNAANEVLQGGGGVDGAIHRAAGPELLEECRGLGGCPTGEARITGGYDLPARHVIHAVGPRWHGGAGREAELLASAYASSLDLAREHGLRTIAFPAISTGAYGYPAEQAAEIAVRTTAHYVRDQPQAFDHIVFCCFSQDSAERHRAALAALGD